LFGFEDLSLGDADYNDVMFTFTIRGNVSLNDIPIYSGGLLQTCRVGLISAADYVESQCYSWALLQPPSAAQCNGFIQLPTGWMIAPKDAITDAVVAARGSTWAQSVPNGCLVANAGTDDSPVGYAYSLTGGLCGDNTLVKYSSNGRCFSTTCANKILLRGISQIANCGSTVDTCSNTPPARVLGTRPSTYVAIPVWPTEYNVYMQKNNAAATIQLAYSVNVPTSPAIDIMILFDTNGAYSNDINLLAQNVGSFASRLTESPQNFDIPNIGFATYAAPTTGTPYVTVNCALQLADTLSNCISGVKLPGTPARTQDIHGALTSLMNLPNSQIGWRTTAYRFALVVSDSAIATTTTVASMSATILAKNIVPVYYLPNPTSSVWDQYQKLASGSATEKLPLTASKYGTLISKNKPAVGDTRMSGWAIATAENLFRPTYNKITYAVTGTAEQNAFITSIPSQLNIGVYSPIAGIYTRNVTVKWSSGVANMPSTYPLSVKVLGFSTPAGETINIITNNPPTAPNAQFSSAQGATQRFTIPSTDADGNQLSITFPCGTYNTINATINTAGTPTAISCGTPYNTLTFDMVPHSLFYGRTTFSYTVTDGCDPVSGTLTFDVSRVNIPPVATDFTFDINEGETVDANLIFSFFGQISDSDDPYSELRISFAIPPTTSLGTLTTAVSPFTAVTAANRNFPKTEKSARFAPNAYESGTVVYPYTVYDPSDASDSATVTINVKPKNDAPVLSGPTTVSGANPGPVQFTVSVTEFDSGDSVTLYAVSHDLGTGSDKVRSALDNALVVSGKATAVKVPLSAVTSTGTTKPYAKQFVLEWADISGLNTNLQLRLQAEDAQGLPSNFLDVTFILAAGTPPRITTNPMAQAPDSNGVGTNNVVEGNEDTDITIMVSGTDHDTKIPETNDDWRNLTIAVSNLPSYGTLSYLTTSDSYAAVVANTPLANPKVTLDITPKNAIFTFRYRGNANYHGQDTFLYYFQDPTLQSSATDTVTITVKPVNDPPTSGDVSLTIDADTTGQFPDFQVSDPDAGDTHNLRVTRLPFNPNTNANRGALKDSDSNFVEVGSSIDSTKWKLLYTPIQNECSSWTTPLPAYAIFNFQVCDQAGACSGNYTGTIYVRCVNHPPRSNSFIERTPQDTPITITIPAADVDSPDTDAVLKFRVTSFAVSNKGRFYYNQLPLETEVDTYINMPRGSEGRTIVYVPEPGSYSTPLSAPVPLATFYFEVVDSKAATSDIYSCNIIVDFVNQPPRYDGSRVVETPENVAKTVFLLYPETYSDDGFALNGTVTGTITKLPTRGTFQVCDQGGCRTVSTTAGVIEPTPIDLDITTYGRVVFTPDLNEFSPKDTLYSTFELTLSDSMGNSSKWDFSIIVLEVNQPPTFIPLFARPPTVKEDEFLALEWRVEDVDSLPSGIVTTIATPQLQSLSRFGWDTWRCVPDGTGPTNCSPVVRDTDVSIGDRANGFPNPVASLVVHEETCVAKPGYPYTDFSNCYAIFKVVFAADPDRYGYQYTQWTFAARDDLGAVSTPYSTLISVLPVNDPPVITAPASISPAAGVDDPSFSDGNVVLSVADPDTLQVSVEQVSFEIVEGSGTFVVPAAARCVERNESSVEWPFKTWICSDTIRGFNRWLPSAKVRVNTAEGSTTVVRVTINDLGAVGVDNLPHLTDTKNITIIYTPLPLVVLPGETNNYLTLAVGIAAAAGILLLALLAWRLRKRFSAPNDDYFQVAVAPLAVAPQNPLYKAQFKEHFSPLYNPDAAK
jgi:hypothetical protein